MADPMRLLFEKLHEGEPIFKSQLDLVQQLLNHQKSPYFTPIKDHEEYARALNRLKAYVSQLLSSNVNRNITEDFRSGLSLLLKERFKNSDEDVQSIFDEIIIELKKKNSSTGKTETKNYFIDQIYTDLASSNYTAIITSRPLEITIDLESKPFSFQKFFLHDLFESFNQPGKNLKCYRFNFPLTQFGEVFWKELKKILRIYILAHQHNQSLYEGLFENYFISTDTLKPLQKKERLSNEELEKIVDEILLYLNHRNRYLLVFIVTLPIYTMPIIALDPDDIINSKIYAVFDTSKHTSIHKYSKEDYLLWRIFVWDKLKTNSKDIHPLKYEPRLFE